jgi:hypothetical protein
MGGFSGPGDNPLGQGVGRDPRLEAFAQARPGGPLKPGAGLTVTLDDVSGPDRRCEGVTDDEALGIASRWAATESWAFAAKLGVVRELIRRRPRPDDECGRVARGDAPTPWERGLEHEVSAELRISLTAAAKLLYLAWALEARLPRIGDALEGGLVDGGQVRMIVTETDVLNDPAQLAAAEEMILAGLPDCKTWMALQRLAALAVCTVDPDGARKRREHAEQENARIRFWRETSGAAGLAGYSLPADETLAANASVEARAQCYREAGITERIDKLRVLAFLDLLNAVPAHDRVSRWQAEQAEQTKQAGEANQADPTAQAAGASPATAPGVPDDAAPGAPNEPAPGNSTDVGCAGGSGGGEGSSRLGLPALPALVNLTLPLATQMRLAERPGEAWGLGALDPELVRRLAEAAARSPHSKFCVTIVNERGHAVAHGCCKRARAARKGAARSGKSPPGSAASAASLTPRSKPGPPGGFGSWILVLPGAATSFTVDLYPVPVGECDHRYESPGHDPSDRLRHLVQVRDGTCSFPTCSRHARETDFEHAVAYEQGGRTCGCNCHSCSRTCHQVKQRPGWSVTEVRPGWHQWTTPSGRIYAKGPWKYPV